MQTQIQMLPPKPPNINKLGYQYPDDYIKELGDRIARLSRYNLSELNLLIRDKI